MLKLQIFRFALFAALISFLYQLGQTGVSLFWLLSAVASGMFIAVKCLQKGISAKKIILIHVAVFIVMHFLSKITNLAVISLFSDVAESDFLIPILSETIRVLLLFYSTSLILTWIFWTKSWAHIFETILTSSLLILTLAAHRQYHVDAPKEISSLSWKLAWLQHLDVQPQHIFMLIGGMIFLGFCLFAISANNRMLFGQPEKIESKGSKSILSTITGLIILALILGVLVWQINSRYNLDLSRMANGVGSSENLEQGQSNLGFHEAVSSTKQPTALVRLEGDYTNNPWKPMLYFREGVLSEFNGREVVKASNKFDQDLPSINPGQSFIGDVNKNSQHRTKLTQSIYLLSDHDKLFAVDFPQKITPIKNPFPEKFKYTYQVTSLAPAYNPDDLKGLKVGDESWDDETWQHYLRAPGSKSKALHLPVPNIDNPTLDTLGEDLRYLFLAEQVSAGVNDPIELAKKFAKYLSDESIYTKEPGHQVTEKGDPVAPYLFAKDKRGFCVHFAHSMVYLLRLMGIPARIGTGYLTELTYAKDGHILLQTGDRHAWAEVYVQDYGWLVFDVTPSRVENEEALIPDESLLQELMSKLSPVEELLAPEIKDLEESSAQDVFKKITPVLIYFLASLVLFFILTKLWLRFAYLFAKDPKRKTMLAYQAFASTMVDVNQGRYYGETRKEYAHRLSRHNIDSKDLTKLLEQTFYTHSINQDIKINQLVNNTIKNVNKIKKFISFFNPSSIFKLRKW